MNLNNKKKDQNSKFNKLTKEIINYINNLMKKLKLQLV